MEPRRLADALLTIRAVAETGSTNADLLALAATGLGEGIWLRADRQTAGRGRQGRAWSSGAGNFQGSTLVRLRPTDPPAPSLALVAGIAVEEAVSLHLSPSPFRRVPRLLPSPIGIGRGPAAEGGGKGEGDPLLKWPNDLMLGPAKLAGILLERSGDAVVVGVGVNLAQHPDLADRPTTSLAAHGASVDPAVFAETLAEGFARELQRWRGEGLSVTRDRWLARAHPPGAALTVRLPDGDALQGLFDGLDQSGALILRLASGESRVIHAGDVFLV